MDYYRSCWKGSRFANRHSNLGKGPWGGSWRYSDRERKCGPPEGVQYYTPWQSYSGVQLTAILSQEMRRHEIIREKRIHANIPSWSIFSRLAPLSRSEMFQIFLDYSQLDVDLVCTSNIDGLDRLLVCAQVLEHLAVPFGRDLKKMILSLRIIADCSGHYRVDTNCKMQMFSKWELCGTSALAWATSSKFKEGEASMPAAQLS